MVTAPLLVDVYSIHKQRRGAIPQFLAQMWELLRLHRSMSSSALTSCLQLLAFFFLSFHWIFSLFSEKQ